MRSERTQGLSADPFYGRARYSPVVLSQNIKDREHLNNGESHFLRHPRFPSRSPKEERGGSSRESFAERRIRYWTFGVFKKTPIERLNSGDGKSSTEVGTRPRMGIPLRDRPRHGWLLHRSTPYFYFPANTRRVFGRKFGLSRSV